jgi:hypothetical protein
MSNNKLALSEDRLPQFNDGTSLIGKNIENFVREVSPYFLPKEVYQMDTLKNSQLL